MTTEIVQLCIYKQDHAGHLHKLFYRRPQVVFQRVQQVIHQIPVGGAFYAYRAANLDGPGGNEEIAGASR